jgi:hypothetical protein
VAEAEAAQQRDLQAAAGNDAEVPSQRAASGTTGAMAEAAGRPERQGTAEAEPAGRRPTDEQVPLDEAAAEQTQVIEVQDPEPRGPRLADTAFDLPVVDDRPHMIPGFDRYDEDETAEVIDFAADSDRTTALPGPDGSEVDDTQIIPSDVPRDTDGGSRRSRMRRRR